MDLFKYNTSLPAIPPELIEIDLSNLEKTPNLFRKPEYEHYKLYAIQNNKLDKFLRNIFNFEFWAGYQVITNGIHIHKDGMRTECLNYQFDTGGDSNLLNIYGEDMKTILLSENIQPNRWHWINVGKYHNVTNLVRPRIGISITAVKTKLFDIP